jgi:hypothetical protein
MARIVPLPSSAPLLWSGLQGPKAQTTGFPRLGNEPAGRMPAQRKEPGHTQPWQRAKDVFVRQYGRWRNGRYQRVRGSWHQMSLDHSPDQLDFGF